MEILAKLVAPIGRVYSTHPRWTFAIALLISLLLTFAFLNVCKAAFELEQSSAPPATQGQTNNLNVTGDGSVGNIGNGNDISVGAPKDGDRGGSNPRKKGEGKTK